MLDAYVNNIQEDLDKLKESNRPSDIYDDTQFKSLERYEIAVEILHHSLFFVENWYLSMPESSFNGCYF